MSNTLSVQHGTENTDHKHDHNQDVALGFWIYILSDCILFAAIFATYAVLSGATAGLITPKEIFDLRLVALGTLLLLLSSFTFGMGMLHAGANKTRPMVTWLGITFLLGLGFLILEGYEFHHFSQLGATPQTSAYWSAFYTLVGTHGLHVLVGLIWMLVLGIHIRQDGLTDKNLVRLSCLSVFWHFLDVIWICVFSIVYLMGVL